MMPGKSRMTFLGGMALASLLVAGCDRPFASDPLGTPTVQVSEPQVIGTSGVPVTGNVTATSQPGVNVTTQSPIPTATLPPPTATPTPVTPTATSVSGSTTYTVRPGDRLFSIGRQFNVNPYSIATANNIQPPYIIRPGQVLVIPSGGGVTPPPGGRTHLVQRGDNLFRISLRYGTTIEAIAAANNITNVRLIFVGQVLRIP
jgi:LysM repeat protein